MSDTDTYRIVRFFAHGDRETIREELTLKEAQAHCQDPETSSKTCSSEEGLELTKNKGSWFDGFYKE